MSAMPPVVRLSVSEATRGLLQAFATCLLDYYNSLLAGVVEVHLHSVQNVALQLVLSRVLVVMTTTHHACSRDTSCMMIYCSFHAHAFRSMLFTV